MTTARIQLPFPPSSNSLFGTNWKTKRRFKTKTYEAWLKLADSEVSLAVSHRFDDLVALKLTLCKPDKRKRDVSNFIKAVEDLLVRHGVIRDDSYVHSVSATWSDDIEGCVVEIADWVLP